MSKDVAFGLILHLPDTNNFFDVVDKESIKLKKYPSSEFYDKEIFISDNNTHIETDIVIFATKFNGVDKLVCMFESKPFRHHNTDST